jgi:RNA polymerase sigma-70 factor (ECF subfamily)
MAMQRPAYDYDSLPEADLVRLAKAGEGEAFRAIMQRCNQRLFRTARAILRDEAEAEDVVQEVYVRAFSKLADFRGDAAILTWLTRITLNEARERLRRRRPTVDVADLDTGDRESAQVILLPTATPEAEAARGEIRRILEQAVDDLPEVFRVVFILREVEDCSIEETAENLGLNPATVKTRLYRARRLLRKALDEKLSSAVTEAFPFLGARCQRISDRVMERLSVTAEN